MSKKLNLVRMNKVVEAKRIFKEISLKIGEEDFDVRLETSFRYKIVEDMFQWLGKNELFFTVLEDENVMASLLILNFLTDIEMGETIDEQVDSLVFLSESGVLAEILNAFPTESLQKYVEEIEKLTQKLEKGMDTLNSKLNLKEVIKDGGKEND